MDTQELALERRMSYYELCNYLKDKYGCVNEDYFLDSKCTRVNLPIKRAKEGLEIHHIAEAEPNVYDLSTPAHAKKYPFEYQSKDNLCYCNLLEHLLLHILINVERSSTVCRLVLDGTLIIRKRLDELYEVTKDLSEHQLNMLRPIMNNYSDYIELTNDWVDSLHRVFSS